jgi:hypothetical protein
MPRTTSRVLTLVAAGLMLAQGVYGLVACWLERYWGPTPFCVAAVVSAIGLAYRRWWSRPLVIALVLLLLVPALWKVWRATTGGVFRDRQASEVCLILLPGLVYIGLAMFCVYVAARYVPGRIRPTQT